MLTVEWSQATTYETRRTVAEMGAWFIAGFCSGLRGEEMLLIEVAGTRASMEFLTDPDCPHFLLTVSGRTKGNQLAGSKFSVPIAARTEYSNLQPGEWVRRLIRLLEERNEATGRLFRRQLIPARLFEFEFDFFRVLREVQSTTNLIDKTLVVEDSFGILRSCRRGMTAHARNRAVTKDDLQTFNRWNKGISSTSGAPRLDMVEHYSSLTVMKPTLLRVTRVF